MSAHHPNHSQSKIYTASKSKSTNCSQINPSLQQLYDLLLRKGKDCHPSRNKYRSASKSKTQGSQYKISFSYEPKHLQKRVNSYQMNRVAKLVNMNVLNNKLETFCKYKTSLYPTDKKNSIQTTNQKLKNIILGKRSKKSKFFQIKVNQEQTIGISSKYGRLQPINQEVLIKRFIFSDNSQYSSQRFTLNQNTQNNQQTEEEKQRLIKKIKTEQPQVADQYQVSAKYKHSKPSRRLMVNGSHLVNLLKYSSKTSEFKQSQKSPNNDTEKKECMVQLIHQQKNLQESEEYLSKSYSPIQTSRKKYKKQSVYLNLFSKLPISEHIIWKIEKMLVFNQFFLQSFGCQFAYTDPRLLSKYHKSNNFYTYYVGMGNNRALIVQTFRKRWWWKQVTNCQNAVFVWTQQKNRKIFSFLNQEKDETLKIQTEMQIMLNLPRYKQLFKKKPEKRCERTLKKLLTHSYNTESNLKAGCPKLRQIQRPSILCNHIQNSSILGDKKDLFHLLKMWILQYKKQGTDILFSFLPQTYHLKNIDTAGYSDYLQNFNRNKNQKTLWIVKPGENSNRGRGIFVSSDNHQISQSVKNRFELGGSTIVQKYKTDLLFYKGRKFDIRTYMVCIIIGENIKYFWYSQGYIRTSSHLFNLKQLDSMIHLTNDAIQNKGEMYGRYQKGNKLSYNQLQSYLNQIFPHKQFKIDSLTSKMKEIAKKIASASYFLIDKSKKSTFQLFGLDFIVDSNFHPWLLQVNTNPCLEVSSPVLQNVIPNLIENVFRLTVDPLFPPNMLPDKDHEYNLPEKIIGSNKFQLIFDSQIQRDQEWQKFCDRNWDFHTN